MVKTDRGWWIALASILLLPCLWFPGAIPGSRVVSADDHLSVHHAFQEAAGGEVRHPALSDPAVQFKALRRRVVASLRAGRAPLWNPDLFGGAPLLGDGQSMVGSPVTWFHLVLPERSAQDLGVWWVLVWTGGGVLLLLRLMGAGPPAAALGGLAAMMGPYVGVWMLHPHAATFAWIPWVLAGLERCRRGKSAVLLALATAGLLAGGHPETAAHGLLIALVWALWRVRRRAVGAGLAVGVALSAPFWLPLLDQISRSATLGSHGGNTLLPAQLLDLLWPGWHGHPAAGDGAGPGIWADGVIHPGLGVLLAVALGWRERLVRQLTLFWGAGILVAMLGMPGPLNHARLGGISALLLAVAAGLALRRVGPRVALVLVVGVVMTGLSARRLDQASLSADQHDPPAAPWAVDLAARVGDGRVAGLGWALQPNTGALAGLKDIRGYDLPVSRDWERFAQALDPRLVRPWFPIEALTPSNRRLLEFAGVRYLVSEAAVAGLEPVRSAHPGPLVLSALDPEAPLVWMASAAVSVRTPEEAITALGRSEAFRERPPVEGFSLSGEAGMSPLSWTRERPEEIRVDLEEAGPGLLVVSEAWAPGWQVEVDGAARPVLRVGGYFQGVALEGGESQAVLRYRPRGWCWGLWLAAAGLLGLLGLVISGRPARSR